MNEIKATRVDTDSGPRIDLVCSTCDAVIGGRAVIINGIDYEARAAELEALGIDPFGDDDRAFGTEIIYCNQHRRVHETGWCAVSNIEKRVPTEEDLEASR